GSHQPLARASLASGLLHQWQQRNLAASLPLALRQLEDAGNLDNVRLAIQADRKNADAEGEATSAADGYGAPGGHRPVGVGPVDPLPGTGYRGPVFSDSDIYKTLEAVGWELAHGHRPGDPELASFAAEVTALLEQGGDLGGEGGELGVSGTVAVRQLPADGLQGLVDVGIGEHRAAVAGPGQRIDRADPDRAVPARRAVAVGRAGRLALGVRVLPVGLDGQAHVVQVARVLQLAQRQRQAGRQVALLPLVQQPG